MGTAVGAAIDYLVAQLLAPAQAVQPDVIVVDGINQGNRSPSILCIGRTSPENTDGPQGPRVLPVLGTRRVDEAFAVPCFIDCWRDGVSQKVSRDAAISLWDVVCHLVATDPSLGGVLSSPWYAEIKAMDLRLVEPSPTAQTRTQVLFSVSAKNRYQP